MGLFGRKKDKPAAEPPPSWAEFFKDAETYDRFEVAIRVYFKSKGFKVLIADGHVRIPPDVPKDSGFVADMGLSNVGQQCALSSESQWPQIIANHFDRLARSSGEIEQIKSMNSDFDRIAPRLAIRLYEPGDIKQILEDTVWRPDIPGLASVLCLDMPDSIHTVRKSQAAEWGPDSDELFDRALSNLNSLIDAKPQPIKIDDQLSLSLIGGESFFNASILLKPERLTEVTGKLGGLISIPTRHLALAVPLTAPSDLSAIGALIHFTTNFERDGPGSLSRRIWWHRADHRIEIPYEVTKKGIQVHPDEEFQKIMESFSEPG